MKVLIVDQFAGPSPYELQQHPVKFDDLVTEVLARPVQPWNAPRVVEVEEDFKPTMCTTVIRANVNGMAEMWKCRWDSSG